MVALLLALLALPPQTPDTGLTVQVEDSGVRMAHPFSLSVELSYNGLAGMGANVGYQITPHFALDAGVGKASTGVKAGARARFNLFTTELTPFFAAGMAMGSGSFGATWEDVSAHAAVHYAVLFSPYAQALAGVSYQDEDGLSMLVGAGWSQLLRDSNVQWRTPPLPQQQRDFPLALESGFLLTASCGYAF